MIRLPSELRPLFPYAKYGVVRFTQLVGPVTRRLPGTERRPSPPHHVSESTPGHALALPDLGIEVVEVEPVHDLRRPMPDGLPSGHPEFVAHRQERVAASLVARIPHGRVVGPYGAIVTPDDTLLYDLSPYFGTFHARQHPIFLRARLPEIRDVAGTVCVLATRGTDNYYHFLTDALPRLELLRRAGIDTSRATFVVNRTTRFQCEILDRLGIPEKRCLQIARLPHIRADELVVPSVPDAHLRTPPWIAPWLRAHFLPPDPTTDPTRRRLYVTRGKARHTRRVENEGDLLHALEPLGFVLVDPGELSVAEQIRHFAEAECVVGAHGAGMTNIAFCPPGATVVELFPPDYVNVCYWALASTVDALQYHYVIGDGLPTRVRSKYHGVMSDVHVDPAAVAAFVGELLRA
jgi:capsular polysaccharide biosynthesis protein